MTRAGPEGRRVALVVGLGNPGPEYASTRHNVGFLAVDRLAVRLGGRWKRASFPGLEALAQAGEHRVVLLKPATYMNLSGKAVAAAARRHRLGPGEICLVHDDLDLPPGAVRVRTEGGAGGHRGILSVIAELGTNAFGRVRVGIGRPGPGVEPADYVLSPFAPTEWEIVAAGVDRAVDAVLAVIADGYEVAMNRFNRREDG